MRLKFVQLVIFSSFLSNSLSENEADGRPVVNVQDQGDVRGEIWTSYGGRSFYTFKTIPYAKPPVGNLRLKRPQDPGLYV